jgi:hypothetical protein
MITFEEFSAFLKKFGARDEDISSELKNFDSIVEAAYKAQQRMPSIGFVSVNARMNCFIAVCRHLDEMIDNGEISLGESQLVLMILRFKNKKFLKAITMFDLRGKRYGVTDRRELPKTAREYLAGILTYG